MNKMRPFTLAAGLAALLGGCAADAYQMGIHRYSGGEPGHDGNHARGLAYQACTVADNSSFEALDACMARSGYQRKDR